jgi:predicted RNase H-like HicB family nuclease
MELTISIHEGPEGFWSEVAELPGCFASGRTLTELDEALTEAVGMCLGDEPVVLEHEPLQVGHVRARVVGDLPPPAAA